ncbi:MAG TPA: hypothetical protein VHE30_08440 [Polyangiaceae bacterium]|nr:hypothetical protein [Polyangiaceae bacterium]
MLRFPRRGGLVTLFSSGLLIACGSSNGVPASGSGGAFPGFGGTSPGYDAGSGGSAFGSGGAESGGAFGNGGASGSGGSFGNGGTFSSGGETNGGAPGNGGASSNGGASEDAGAFDSGVPDGAASDGGAAATDSGLGSGGTGAGGASNGGASSGGASAGGAGSGGASSGGASNGGASSGGASAGGAGSGGASSGGAGNGGAGTGGTGGTQTCGNSIPEGTEACDDGGVDTANCDSDCTKPVCSDKHLNTAAGEFCDDGNKTPGDGCNANCQFENICPTPLAIALSATTPGTVHGTATGDTSDSSSYVHPALCDGAVRGAGPDSIYSFTLDRTRNVTVSLSAGFDAILRTYTKACDPSATLAEANGDACSDQAIGTEAMSFSRLAKGTYYVAVDGAQAGNDGTFSLQVDAVCDGQDQLRIVELGIGTTDYAVIRNLSDCPAALGGSTVKFDDSTQTDLVVSLPAMTLAPGEQLRIQEGLGSTAPGVLGVGSIPFQYVRGGTVLLCKTNCSSASDVLDVVQFADAEPSVLEPPPAPPAGVTNVFPLTGIDGTNQDTKSWVRVGTTGKSPSFTGGDWCTGEPGAAFGLRLEEVFLGDPDYLSIKNHADCAVPVAPFRVRLTTDGASTPIDAVLDGGSLSLSKGATLFLSEPPNKPGDVNTGVAIPNAGGVSGTVQLCLGSCATGGATVDAIAWDGVVQGGGSPTPFPALPTPISFSPGGLQGITDQNQNTTSYRRAAIAGTMTRFLASDWTASAKSR